MVCCCLFSKKWIMSSSSKINFKDIKLHELSLFHLDQLTKLLDTDDEWIEVAKQMNFQWKDIEQFKKAVDRKESPTKELIIKWADYNHTLTELFVVLSRAKQYMAMEILKGLVDKKFHSLIVPEFNRKEKTLNIPVQPKSNSNENNESKTKPTEKDLADALKSPLGNITTSSIPEIDYEELVVATQNWSEHLVLGKGGFGKVYKGTWKFTNVAIKKVTNRPGKAMEDTKIQFRQTLNELQCLNAFRHDNILPLYGYSMSGVEPCLIYQLMAGSLEDRLHPQDRQLLLNWNQRLNILTGSARGINFLHSMKKPLIHGDIKPANILLDASLEPKLGDFGLSREGPADIGIKVNEIFGTKAYLPLEFLREKILSTKVDVYSFGVVLYQVGTGLRAYSHNDYNFLANHMFNRKFEPIENLIDRSVDHDVHCLKICQQIIFLGHQCTSKEPQDRPKMDFVLQSLDRERNFQLS